MKRTIDELVEEIKADSLAGVGLMSDLLKALNEDMKRTAEYIQRFKILYTYTQAETIYKNNRVVKRLKKTKQNK